MTRLPPNADAGPWIREPCDDMDRMPDYENVLSDLGPACQTRPLPPTLLPVLRWPLRCGGDHPAVLGLRARVR
jgi:hypothetical protein